MSYEKILNIENKEDKMRRTEILGPEHESFFEKLVKIQELSFPKNFTEESKYDFQELREFINDKDNIIIALIENDEVQSFVMAEPYSSAYKELVVHDDKMETPSETVKKYYVSTITVPPERRKKMDYFVLVRALAGELDRRGIRNLVMHAKTRGRYSERIQKFCKRSKLVRTSENWLGSGEKFDYIEMDIQNEDFDNFDKLINRRIKSA